MDSKTTKVRRILYFLLEESVLVGMKMSEVVDAVVEVDLEVVVWHAVRCGCVVEWQQQRGADEKRRLPRHACRVRVLLRSLGLRL